MVLVSVPTSHVAELIARTLVTERLVACANIVPGVRSIYEWKGALCDDHELLLVLKTRASAFEQVRARVVALHPYELPEVIRLDVTAGNAPYLAWVRSSVA